MKKDNNRIAKFWERHTVWHKLICLLLFGFIIYLAVMDGFSTYELFKAGNESQDHNFLRAKLYGVLFAGLLEGIPSLISYWMAQYFDVNKNRDPLKAKMTNLVFWVLVVSLFGIFFVELYLRGNFIHIKVTTKAYRNTLEEIKDIFLLLSPLFTSACAFALSAYVLPSDPLAEQKRKLNRLTLQGNKKNEKVNSLRNELEQEQRLLYALIAPGEAKIPYNNMEFSEAAYKYSVNKAKGDVLESIPRLADSFTDKGRAALLKYVFLLSRKTTVPLSVSNIDINKFLEDYDKKIENPVNRFNGTEASNSLKREFLRRVSFKLNRLDDKIVRNTPPVINQTEVPVSDDREKNEKETPEDNDTDENETTGTQPNKTSEKRNALPNDGSGTITDDNAEKNTKNTVKTNSGQSAAVPDVTGERYLDIIEKEMGLEPEKRRSNISDIANPGNLPDNYFKYDLYRKDE